MSALLQRVFSGVVFVGLMLTGILWNYWSLTILLTLILVKGLLEFYKLVEALGYQPFKGGGTAIGVAMFLGTTLVPRFPVVEHALVWAPLILVLAGVWGCLNSTKAGFLAALSFTVFGWIYLTLPLTLLGMLGAKGGAHQGSLVLFVISLVWINDTMAYAVGKTLGRQPLALSLSPGKTREGTMGGILCSMIAGWIWYGTGFLNLTLTETVIVALLTAVGAIVGDLFQSGLKRLVGWEDAGSLIPGHGGVLDRFDGLLISILVVFPFLYVW